MCAKLINRYFARGMWLTWRRRHDHTIYFRSLNQWNSNRRVCTTTLTMAGNLFSFSVKQRKNFAFRETKKNYYYFLFIQLAATVARLAAIKVTLATIYDFIYCVYEPSIFAIYF